MSQGQRVARNASFVMVGGIVSKLCLLVAGIVIARYLGQEGFGVYSFALFFSYLFAVLSDGGLQIILVREAARDKERAGFYLGNILLIKLALAGLSLVLLSGAMVVMDLEPIKVQAVYVAALANVIWFYGSIAIGVFRAFERMAYEGLLLALQGALFLLLVLAAIFVEAGVLVLLGAFLVSYVIPTLLGFVLVGRRFVRLDLRLDLSLCRVLLREAAPIGLSLFLAMAYNRLGTIALEVFQGSADVGLFNAAFKLTRNLNLIPLVLAGAVLPAFSRLAVSEKQGLSSAYGRAFKLLLALGLPLAVGGTLLAEPIIVLIYGAEFVEGSIALQVTIWSLLFFFLSFLAKTTLEALNEQVRWTYALGAGVLISVVLNLLLVPRWGILGASVALLVADVMIFLLSFYFLTRELRLPFAPLALAGLKSIGSVTAMGLALYSVGELSLPFEIATGAIVYVLLILGLQVFDREELNLLKSAVGLKN